MAIIYHPETRTFHLQNKQVSYIFTILKNGKPGQLYYGKRIQDREDFSHLLELESRTMSACAFLDDRAFSMEHIKQEYPDYGAGDVREPAFTLLQKNGSQITHFVYESHLITDGKPKLPGLPATYTDTPEEAQTLKLTLYDALIDTRIILYYTIFRDLPVITRSARFICQGPEGVRLLRAMSCSVDLSDDNYDLITLTGSWQRERSICRRSLVPGLQGIYSARGNSSHQFNPFLALARPETTEQSGEVYGFSFVYSGNFFAAVDVDTYHVTRLLMGIHPQGFDWPLADGEVFQTPEVVMVYSDAGLNAMSQTYHTLYRTRLTRGIWRDKSRPILFNSWEAFYFKFDQQRLLSVSKLAAELGAELLVVDDGWFGHRDNDRSSLGDWYPDKNKLPNGIRGLYEQVHALGLELGIWIEPEMVSEDSDLFRAHPEWRLQTPERPVSQSRSQYVLDYANQQVVDHIFEMLEKLLSEAPITYVKWDMNRSISEAFSAALPAEEQGTVMHRYILGVYELYERLIQRFPHILFESCSSGGGRCDPGMLYYAPQCWISDCTDAWERVKIQYGTSMVYPVISLGGHLAAVPNHHFHRSAPLDTRANVAYFGTFGYELDITRLPEEELEVIRRQISFMKQHRVLIQRGQFYRLHSPFTDEFAGWIVCSEDQTEALAGYYTGLGGFNIGYRRLKLAGLKSSQCYLVSWQGGNRLCYGDELMQAGIPLADGSAVYPDFSSQLFYLTAE